MRPTAMIFREPPSDPWTDYDFALIEAYTMLEQETCPQCGKPIWLCRSQSNTFRWKVQSDVCYSTKALKQHEDNKKPRAQRAKTAKEKSEWGKFYYTIPELHTLSQEKGLDLPTREEYYAELMERVVN